MIGCLPVSSFTDVLCDYLSGANGVCCIVVEGDTAALKLKNRITPDLFLAIANEQ